ncbi:MAG: helix-turn-helix transcriptional regulator [Sphingobacteriales bacterium JAD_PAG50586_3]|nr:MAG: helix-turn-helix transcriptional regulator [Sphingobacteriales bacterium JAD_PAG50586_3]
MKESLAEFVKKSRKNSGLTQQELADKAGVGIHFIRDLEQGKTNLQTGKVNTVLYLFGYTLGPIPLVR